MVLATHPLPTPDAARPGERYTDYPMALGVLTTIFSCGAFSPASTTSWSRI